MTRLVLVPYRERGVLCYKEITTLSSSSQTLITCRKELASLLSCSESLIAGYKERG